MITSRINIKKAGMTSALAAAIAVGGAGLAEADPTTPENRPTHNAAVDDGNAFAAQARHGFVGNDKSDVVARAALKDNANLGAVQWEPQSLEAPKGFPQGGPPDGKIASANTAIGANLDEQSSTRWVKNQVRPGDINIGWNYTAPHNTSKWHYYITKNGWDQNAPLSRAALEPLATIDHDGTAASNNPTHRISLPADHTGYHTILTVWDVADTANAFYNVIDVDIQENGDPNQPDPGNPDNPDQPDPDNPDNPDQPAAPTAPSHLHSMGTTSNSVDLMWFASTDDVGVSHYEVMRSSDGGAFTPLGTTDRTSFLDDGLTPDTQYQYKIAAYDADGNVSADSNILSVTTKAEAGNPDAAPTWDSHAQYNIGDRVTHDGATYEAVQTHQGYGDPNWITAPALWKKV